MTKQECAIIMTHTGVCMLTGDEMEMHFVEKEFLPEGQDEYYLRNQQTTK